MVRLRVKVGPKGQIVIPKVLRDAYNIVEGDFVYIEPREDGLLIRRKLDIEQTIEWIRMRRKRIKGLIGTLGQLRGVDLEDAFEE